MAQHLWQCVYSVGVARAAAPVAPIVRTHQFEVVFINLASRPDRRLAIEGQLQQAGLTASRLQAYTGDGTPDTHVSRTWDSTLNAQYDTRTIGHPCVIMSGGERGCAMSHRVLWEIAAARPDDAPPVLILEDDAVLADHFVSRLVRLIQTYEASFPDPATRLFVVYLCANVAQWHSHLPPTKLEPGLAVRETVLFHMGAHQIVPDSRIQFPGANNPCHLSQG